MLFEISFPCSSITNYGSLLWNTIYTGLTCFLGPPEAPMSISTSAVKNHRLNITWESSALSPDNNSPVNKVIVEYKTLYEPGIWYTLQNVLLKGENRAEIKISPWAFYTFRVILINDIGESAPSPETSLIQSPAAGQWNLSRNQFINFFN